MPLPIPKKTEDINDFTIRCIMDTSLIADYPDPDARIMICANIYLGITPIFPKKPEKISIDQPPSKDIPKR